MTFSLLDARVSLVKPTIIVSHFYLGEFVLHVNFPI